MELSKSDTAGIKGIAILFMLWHHLFLHSTEYGTLTQSLAVVFKVCVALFLFVSGYGLTKQYSGLEKRNVRTTILFLLRRFINFFLPFWFCFVLVIVIGNLCGYSFQDAYPVTRNTLKCVILDFFGQMGYDSYLKPWWFNKMIIQLYLVFPFLYVILYNRYTGIVGLFAIILVQLFAKRVPGNLFFIVEGGLPAFCFGMMASHFRIISGTQKKARRIAFSVAVLFVGGALAVLLLKVIKDSYQAVFVRAFLALCIVVAFKMCDGGYSHVLNIMGKYAATMYLTHMLLLLLLPKFFYYSSYSVPVFVSFVLACLVLAMVINWLERVSHFDKLRIALTQRISSL